MTIYTDKRATIVQVSTGAAYVLFSNLYEDVMLEVDEEGLDLDQSLLDDQIDIVSGPHGSTRDAEDWCHAAGWAITETVVA
jgi:hypothetical protein